MDVNKFYKSIEGRMHLIINDDPDLSKLYIPLKKPPAPRYIDGYDHKREQQFFKYQRQPDILLQWSGALEGDNDESKDVSINELHQRLKSNQREFRREIRFIKKQHYYIDQGYHFYNNGRVEYITGSHFAYNNYWDIKSYRPDGLPEYRFRDMVFFNTLEWAKNDAKTLGIIYYKHRREGATMKALCDWYFTGIRKPMQRHGFQSHSESKASDTWDEDFINAWSKLPFYLMAQYSGNERPKKELVLLPKAQAIKSTGALAKRGEGIGTKFDYKPAGLDQYDRAKLNYYYFDEFGKRNAENPVDSYDRYMKVRNTMIEGSTKVGFAVGTSTIGDEAGDEGGIEYSLKFYRGSKYWVKTKSGMSVTGLVPLFIDSAINLGGFNDMYGDPIMDTPEGIKTFNSEGAEITQGSIEFLDSMLEQVTELGDWNTINETIRKHPRKFWDCFRTSSAQAMFNQVALNDAILDCEREEQAGKSTVLSGRFEWKDPMTKTHAYFVSDPTGTPEELKGPWRVSQQPEESRANKYYIDPTFSTGNGRVPMYPGDFTVSCDPTRYEKTKLSERSMFGCTVKRTYSEAIDPKEKPISEWKTDCIVADYLAESDNHDKTADEVLKACVYYSCMYYGENINTSVNERMEAGGWHGYQMFRMDSNGKIDPNAGFSTQTKSKQVMLSKLAVWVNRRARWDKHKRVLDQLRSMRKPEDLTNYDLVTCIMGNVAAEENLYGKFVTNIIERRGDSNKIMDFLNQ